MKTFSIRRTSDFHAKPCEEAYQKGDDDKWFIDISDFEYFLALIEKYGPVIVGDADYEQTDPIMLEIYDNWRE